MKFEDGTYLITGYSDGTGFICSKCKRQWFSTVMLFVEGEKETVHCMDCADEVLKKEEKEGEVDEREGI